jgi:hypothetical protein
MSRARFGILLALVVLIVAVGAFALVLTLMGDDEPDESSSATSPTASTLPTTTLGEQTLTTPTFVAVVASSGDEATAQALAAELTERGYDSGVLHSDDHTSLEPGFWVAYTGPFPDAAAAQASADQLKGDGYTSAYPRCVGTAEQCA